MKIPIITDEDIPAIFTPVSGPLAGQEITLAVRTILITNRDTAPEHERLVRLREHARTLEHHCNVRLSELNCDAHGVVLRH